MIRSVNAVPVSKLLAGKEQAYLFTGPNGAERVAWLRPGSAKRLREAKEQSAVAFGCVASAVKARRY